MTSEQTKSIRQHSASKHDGQARTARRLEVAERLVGQVWGSLGVLALGVLWCGVVPFLFLMLYATLQMQADAKAEIQNATPTVYVEAHSERIGHLNRMIVGQAKALSAQAAQLNHDYADYSGKKNAMLADLTALTAYDPAPVAFDACHASRDAAIACHDRIVMAAQQRLQAMPADQRGDLLALLKDTALKFADFLGAGALTQNEVGAMKSAESRLGLVQADEAALTGTSDSKLTAVTDTYNEMCRKLPGFATFFLFPDGVNVALFTGVMGAIGAAVFSLYSRLRAGSRAQGEGLARSFVLRPLLGALAGFMVYFVVSAGTVFLMQPSANLTAAVNSLSPSALASLGLFAGIAAENVLRWLSERAAGVFKVQTTPSAAGKTTPRRRTVQDAP
jgi:hypothetical protein